MKCSEEIVSISLRDVSWRADVRDAIAAVAVALLTLDEQGGEAVTIEGKLNYLAKVTQGDLVAVGRIVHHGRTVALGDTEVFRADGKLCAKGLMTYTLIHR